MFLTTGFIRTRTDRVWSAVNVIIMISRMPPNDRNGIAANAITTTRISEARFVRKKRCINGVSVNSVRIVMGWRIVPCAIKNKATHRVYS